MGRATSAARRPAGSSLRHSSDDEPGYTRRRAGRGFVYLDEQRRRISDEKTLARIRSLAIPPAYTDVWICPDPRGHVQATGRDARGRKQYRYHRDWTAERDAAKYERLLQFGEALPRIRRRVAADLTAGGLCREQVVATVVHLLQATLIRVGNEEYAKANGSYGITTLRVPHAHVDGAQVRLKFRGKSGQDHDVSFRDRRIASIVRRCRDLPGQRLFQWVDEGELRPVGSADVNEYLREAAGDDYTAKDFRTWMGTLLAATALAELPPPADDREGRRAAAAAIEVVARHLGNTPTVARTSYVHPDIVDLYVDGELEALWQAGPDRDGRWLVREERRLLGVLRAAQRRQRAAA